MKERDLLGLAHAADRRERIVGGIARLAQDAARDQGRAERGRGFFQCLLRRDQLQRRLQRRRPCGDRRNFRSGLGGARAGVIGSTTGGIVTCIGSLSPTTGSEKSIGSSRSGAAISIATMSSKASSCASASFLREPVCLGCGSRGLGRQARFVERSLDLGGGRFVVHAAAWPRLVREL